MLSTHLRLGLPSGLSPSTSHKTKNPLWLLGYKRTIATERPVTVGEIYCQLLWVEVAW
jgi:hypothetical protein